MFRRSDARNPPRSKVTTFAAVSVSGCALHVESRGLLPRVMGYRMVIFPLLSHIQKTDRFG
jgi:hypothetical protein